VPDSHPTLPLLPTGQQQKQDRLLCSLFLSPSRSHASHIAQEKRKSQLQLNGWEKGVRILFQTREPVRTGRQNGRETKLHPEFAQCAKLPTTLFPISDTFVQKIFMF